MHQLESQREDKMLDPDKVVESYRQKVFASLVVEKSLNLFQFIGLETPVGISEDIQVEPEQLISKSPESLSQESKRLSIQLFNLKEFIPLPKTSTLPSQLKLEKTTSTSMVLIDDKNMQTESIKKSEVDLELDVIV